MTFVIVAETVHDSVMSVIIIINIYVCILQAYTPYGKKYEFVIYFEM